MDRMKRLCERSVAGINVIQTFTKGITGEVTLYTLETQLDRLEAHFKGVNDLEEQLYSYKEYEPISERVEAVYVETKAKLLAAISKRKQPQETMDLNTTLENFIGQQKSFYEGVNHKRVQLPKLQIEAFNGDYRSWPAFSDLYESTIHLNEALSAVHKLQLLKSLVKGDAAALIGHLSITEANYTIAWDKLVKRYNKPKPILGSLI